MLAALHRVIAMHVVLVTIYLTQLVFNAFQIATFVLIVKAASNAEKIIFISKILAALKNGNLAKEGNILQLFQSKLTKLCKCNIVLA